MISLPKSSKKLYKRNKISFHALSRSGEASNNPDEMKTWLIQNQRSVTVQTFLIKHVAAGSRAVSNNNQAK